VSEEERQATDQRADVGGQTESKGDEEVEDDAETSDEIPDSETISGSITEAKALELAKRELANHHRHEMEAHRKRLSSRQLRFLVLYKDLGDKRQALQEAGFSCSTERVVQVTLARLWRHPHLGPLLKDADHTSPAQEVMDRDGLRRWLTRRIRAGDKMSSALAGLLAKIEGYDKGVGAEDAGLAPPTFIWPDLPDWELRADAPPETAKG
jgi:hypothetical protein